MFQRLASIVLLLNREKSILLYSTVNVNVIKFFLIYIKIKGKSKM